MLGIQDFWLFVAAGLMLNIAPGPDMALVAGRSLQLGVRAGLAAALGIGAGCLVHISAAAIGISAILASSAVAFTVLKWIGAAYLVYIGLQMLMTPASGSPPQSATGAAPTSELGGIFPQGFWTNVLNPKVAMFFLAFVPQFIRADAPSKATAFLALGAVFNLTGTAWNLAVAWFAGRLAEPTGFGRARIVLDRALGVLFVVLGVRLALSERL